MKAVIYHNPRCSKSRQTLELLNKHKENNPEINLEIEIIEYLKIKIDQELIINIFNLLKSTPPASIDINNIRGLMRKKEKYYKEHNLSDVKLSDKQLINHIINNPILLERPIVIYNNKAVICRPPELALELFK